MSESLFFNIYNNCQNFIPTNKILNLALFYQQSPQEHIPNNNTTVVLCNIRKKKSFKTLITCKYSTKLSKKKKIIIITTYFKNEFYLH